MPVSPLTWIAMMGRRAACSFSSACILETLRVSSGDKFHQSRKVSHMAWMTAWVQGRRCIPVGVKLCTKLDSTGTGSWMVAWVRGRLWN